jgi:hypothetical protein
MDAIKMLEVDLKHEQEAALSIQETADARGEGFSDAERATLSEHLKNMERLTIRIADEKDKQSFREKVEGFNLHVNGQIDPNPVRNEAQADASLKARSLGEAFVSSATFKAWQAATKENGKPPRFQTTSVFVPESRFRGGMKTAGDPVLESDNATVFAGGPGPLTTFLGLETPGFLQFRLAIEDLLTTIPITTGNSVTYPVVKTRTQISGTSQVEGAAKPGGEYEFDMVTKTLETKAGWVKLSTQFIEDAPGLVAYINSDLPLQIRQNVQAYLADALWDAAQNPGGGGAVAGAGIGGTNGFDAILEAITVIQENGGEPNAMVIAPADWAALRALKNTGGDEDYVGGGPFTPTNNPWDLRVVITPSAVPGEPLVGDFARGAKIYSRGGYSVDSTNTDQDDFIKNKFTVRAERRLVVGVTYPELFAVAQTGTS